MSTNQFVYKPVSEADGNLAVLLPSSIGGATVDIVDAQGNVLSSGRDTGRTNQNRLTYRFDRPGSAYGENINVRVTQPDGSTTLMPIQSGGQRAVSDGLNPGSLNYSQPTSGGGHSRVPTIQTSASGENQQVMPTYVNPTDYVRQPYVDYETNLARATAVGQANRDTLFGELTGEQAKQAALGLVRTDIQGIQEGVSALAPTIREQGTQDVSANIARAGTIDAFELSRIPGFNQAITEEHEKTVGAAGLDYRKRITEVLDQLRAQTKGELPGELDDALTTRMRNRGADITTASGISPTSRAGIRAQDLLDVTARVGIMQDAQKTLPSVLTQGQAVLQPPTLQPTPTQVPFIASDISSRLPVQSNLSAGSAQQGIAGALTDMATIPAETVLSSGLSTDQFNANAMFSYDQLVYGAEQAYANAYDNAQQQLINADKGDVIRQEQYDMFQQGLDQRKRSEWIQAGTTLGGAFLGSGVGQQAMKNVWDWAFNKDTSTTTTQPAESVEPARDPATGEIIESPYVPQKGTAEGDKGMWQSVLDNAGDAWNAVSNDFGQLLNRGNQYINSYMSSPSAPEAVTVGSNTVTQQDIAGLGADMKSLSDPADIPVMDTPAASDGYQPKMLKKNPAPKMYEDKNIVDSGVNENGESYYVMDDGSTELASTVDSYNANKPPSIVERTSAPLQSTQLDSSVLGSTAETVMNWGNMDAASKLASSGSLGVNLAQANGMVNTEDARRMNTTVSALGTLADPNASDEQKAMATTVALASVGTTGFTGTIDSPRTIEGKAVIGNAATPDGRAGYLVDTGNGNTDVIARDDLLRGGEAAAAINAYAVLNSKADKVSKVAALTAIGMNEASAHKLVSNVAAGNTMAGLSLFSTARNWDDMSILQKSVASINTTSAVLDATINTINSSASASAATAGAMPGVEKVADALGPLAAGVSFAFGAKNAVDTISAVNDMPKSQATKQSMLGLGMAGASMGASVGSMVPGLGTAAGAGAGAIIGATYGAAVPELGGGKGSGQMMRDEWRNGLRELGISSKDHRVTLADGTKYNIGLDGGAELTNTDGTTRLTTEVDWSNNVAVNSIPAAHLFSMATGLNPTDNSKFDMFDTVTAQALNAATSNATTVEEAQANIKAMLDNANVQPQQIAFNAQLMRSQNKISDQEFGVYLNTINNMYGTNIQPANKEQVVSYVQSSIEQKGANASKAEKELLRSLTDTELLASNQASLDKRLGNNLNNIRDLSTPSREDIARAFAARRILNRKRRRR